MGEVIKFPKRQGNAGLKVDAIPVYDKEPNLEEATYEIRMRRIKESLTKIANLMNELKGTSSYEKK